MFCTHCIRLDTRSIIQSALNYSLSLILDFDPSHKLIRSKDVKFLEKFRTSSKETTDIFELEASPVDPASVAPKTIEFETEIEPMARTPLVVKRKCDRPKIVRIGRPGRPRKLYNQVIKDPETSKYSQEVSLARELDPMTVSEALNSHEAEERRTAMFEEYEAHIANGTL